MSARHWTPAKKRLGPRKKHVGASAKKHLEYRPEPISLRPRNRPEMMVPRRLECPEQAFKSSAPRGWQRRPSKERKPESESRNRRQTGSPPFIPRRSSVGAHLFGTVARTTGVCNTAVRPRVRAAIAEDTLRVRRRHWPAVHLRPIDGGELAAVVTHGENGKLKNSEPMKRNGGISAAANEGWRNSKS